MSFSENFFSFHDAKMIPDLNCESRFSRQRVNVSPRIFFSFYFLFSATIMSLPQISLHTAHWYQCSDCEYNEISAHCSLISVRRCQCHWNQCSWPLMLVLRLSVQLKSVLHPLTSVPWPLISVKRTLISVPESTDILGLGDPAHWMWFLIVKCGSP